MSYPNPLQTIVRSIAPNVVITLCPFKRMGAFNFGARMSLVKYQEGILVYAAIPYGPEIERAIKVLQGENPVAAPVTHVVIPDTEHTMAAKSFKAQFPDLKIISMQGVASKDIPVDYEFSEKHGHKIVTGSGLTSLGLLQAFADSFEFVYLPKTGNRELVLYDKASKLVFEADLVFTLGQKTLEQYSSGTGYKDLYYPHGGLSFLTRYMYPTSKVGKKIMRKINNATASAPGLREIYLWDFKTMVPCHGNVMDGNGKDLFKELFPEVS